MNIGVTLIITLIGMGLVFGALLLLWGLMEIMVKLTAEKPAADESVEDVAFEPAGIAVSDPSSLQDGKQRAAAAAVVVAMSAGKQQAAAVGAAVAMAVQSQTASSFSQAVYEPPSTGISAWQAVLRAGQYNQRSTKSQK